MSKIKKRGNRNVNQLRKLYARPAVATAAVGANAVGGAGGATVKSQSADPEMSDHEIMMNKLVKRDITRTVAVSLILIILLSAIYAIRDTVPVQNAINTLATYTGF